VIRGQRNILGLVCLGAEQYIGTDVIRGRAIYWDRCD